MTDYVRFQERSRLEGTCQQRLEGPNLFLLGESDENLRRHCDVVKNAAIKARMKHPQNITKVQFYFQMEDDKKNQNGRRQKKNQNGIRQKQFQNIQNCLGPLHAPFGVS